MGQTRENSCREFFKYEKTENKSTCKIRNTDMVGVHAANLERHLKGHRTDEYNTAQRKAAKKIEESIRSVPKKQPKKLHKFAVPECLKVKLDKQTLAGAYVELATVNGCSFELIEYSEFCKILNPIIASIGQNFSVNLENIREMIPHLFLKLSSKFSSNLEKQIVALKVDVASRLSRSVLGIDVRFRSLLKTVRYIYCHRE
ncbi:uncharacterized protein LOC126058202 [Elephas maximus indicus]|uniref:uncharacterized protein LOC126058202 n=1 Tax=Elephas maximus indicus TaxID=99487 RepID=UPI002115DFFB|nr:uncharacterized protein LOC126058202 [Elephas maximus indicus]